MTNLLAVHVGLENAINRRGGVLYLRGAVVGLGLGYGVTRALAVTEMMDRVVYGFGVGVAAMAGVNLLRDGFNGMRGRGRLQW